MLKPVNVYLLHSSRKQKRNIIAVNPGWAEQDPESWWENLKLATQAVMTESGVECR